jgi:hypothetical protein
MNIGRQVDESGDNWWERHLAAAQDEFEGAAFAANVEDWMATLPNSEPGRKYLAVWYDVVRGHDGTPL